ncbi:hypothetical protein [Nostoc sp. DSM 114167]|uniref:hypothetical protein n=1 Tax=Nostoc sp. DSM 114167 TaxID=3439050 RepID=UPI0040456315
MSKLSTSCSITAQRCTERSRSVETQYKSGQVAQQLGSFPPARTMAIFTPAKMLAFGAAHKICHASFCRSAHDKGVEQSRQRR